MGNEPHELRRGWLKNGNPLGDFSMARRCSARGKRSGQPCRGPAMRRKRRCRLHGDKSTGPRTPEGLARSRRARWKHGSCSVEARCAFLRAKAECQAFNLALRAQQGALIAILPPAPAPSVPIEHGFTIMKLKHQRFVEEYARTDESRFVALVATVRVQHHDHAAMHRSACARS